MSDVHIMSGKDADAVEQEVNRLRADLAAANKRSNTHYDLLVIALRQRDTALAQVTKLREALVRITRIEDDKYGTDWQEIEEARAIASAVLKETGNE